MYQRLLWTVLTLWLGAWIWHAWHVLRYPLSEVLPGSVHKEIWVFAVIFAAFYTVACVLIVRFQAWMRPMFVLAGLVIALAIAMPPTRSPDLYWNLAVGKMWVSEGADPYRLEGGLPDQKEWSARAPFIHSIPYGPLWTYLIGAVAAVTDSVRVAIILVKLVGAAAFAAGAVAVWKLMQAYGIDPSRRQDLLALMLLNPLILQSGFVDMSNDLFTFAVIAWAMLLTVRARYIPAAAILLLGGLVKFVPWLLIPIPLAQMILEQRLPSKEDITMGLGGLAAAVLAILPFGMVALMSEQTKEFFDVFSNDHMAFPGAWLLLQAGLAPTQTHVIGLIISIAAMVFCISQRKWLAAWIVPLGTLLFFAGAWVSPWYLLWLVPGAAALDSALFLWAIGTAGILMAWVIGSRDIGCMATGAALLAYTLRNNPRFVSWRHETRTND